MKVKKVSEEKMKELAKVVFEFRRRNQYSQDYMAILLKLRQNTISNIENRKILVSEEMYETIMRFCKNYDSVDDLQTQCYNLIKNTPDENDLKLIKAFIIALGIMKKTVLF